MPNKSPYAVLKRLKPCKPGHWRPICHISAVLATVLIELYIKIGKDTPEPFSNDPGALEP